MKFDRKLVNEICKFSKMIRDYPEELQCQLRMFWDAVFLYRYDYPDKIIVIDTENIDEKQGDMIDRIYYTFSGVVHLYNELPDNMRTSELVDELEKIGKLLWRKK